MARDPFDELAPRTRLPNFVIIGAQKAATTTLEGWLARHPDVWMPDTEEAHFRDPVYQKRDLEEFARQYAGRDARMLGLKCPDYLGRPEVPARLANDLDMPRLLVSLRNPVQRAVSAYFWNMRWGTIPIADLNTGLRTILDGPSSPGNPYPQEILDWGLYGKHVTRYLTVFPLDHLHVLLEEDFRVPDVAWRSSARFLDLDPDILEVGATARSRNEGIYSLARLRFLQVRTPSVLRRDARTGYATIDKPTNPAVRAFSNAVAATDRFVLRPWFDNKPPALEADVRNRLIDFYREDVLALQDLLSRDLTDWLS